MNRTAVQHSIHQHPFVFSTIVVAAFGGVEVLFNQTSAARARLEEDLKQADFLVARIRQRLLPLIEKEIDKLPLVMP